MSQDRRPTHVARANLKKHADDKDRWVTIGSAWTFELQDRTEALSVRLDALPIGWDGSFTILPKRED